jgi:upstream activation factor subunit UAF30
MPRQSKSKTDVTETVSAAPTSNTTTAAPVVTKAKKETKPKAPKTADVVTASSAVVDTPVVAVANTVVDTADADAAELVAQSTEFLSKLNQISTLIASLKTEYRSLEKKWTRELKTAQKSQAKRKRKTGNRQPSGFVKPTRISDELAKFLEKPLGSEMARTDVTREINKYIRSHNLQDKENGRKINPDAKLQTLLKLKKTDELTYFNIQRYMSPHFAKAEKAAAAAVSTSV